MANRYYNIVFLLFLISGFCGLLYQVVWLRMAYSSFGVITPVMSVVISIYMLGLSIGSWGGGKWITVISKKCKTSAIIFYAVAEIFIGAGALLVPVLFSYSADFLLTFGEIDSAGYLFYSAVAISISILPWCVFMGFTFPFMMAFIKEIDENNTTAFSHLYFANVIGAMLGALITAVVIIEIAGFKNTLLIAASMNFFIAFVSIIIGIRQPFTQHEKSKVVNRMSETGIQRALSNAKTITASPILFATGFISMSMEVVWIRGFTPVLKTRTYSFASLLAVYLLATWIGSYLYRKHLSQDKVISTHKLLSGLSVFSLLPIVLNDPRLNAGIPAALSSISLFCASLGYLTPKLIDRYSLGQPYGAGKAYAYNILGCIIGPIFASYILLPAVGVKMSLMILSAPFLVFILVYYKETVFIKDWSVIMSALALFLFFHAGFVSESYEEVYASYPGSEVRRDHTATTISLGNGLKKRLLVNGIGITSLTPITKIMAHLPLSFCQEKPESALVICFGMGTTFRSLLSWDIETTAIELVPSVKDAFGYYFDNAKVILRNPKGKIVIDDGRRFLKRTTDTFDVITIDPPPPIEIAGSSLLYSEEFYEVAKQRLKKGGILHQWFPKGEKKILNAVARSLSNSFPHIKTYISIGGWGVHFICSTAPLEELNVDRMVSVMPKAAQNDLLEWYKDVTPENLVNAILAREVQLSDFLIEDDDIVITDDRPFNEYYVLRRLLGKIKGTNKTTW